MLDLKIPFGSFGIPDGRGELVLEANVLQGIELLRTSLQVGQNIASFGIMLRYTETSVRQSSSDYRLEAHLSPSRIRLERIAVDV